MSGLKIDSSKLNSGLQQLHPKTQAAILMYAATKAKDIEFKMKRNRPWTDRTGMAKRNLRTQVSKPSETVVRITLAHGVSYGVNLELSHNKKYAIIKPTLDAEAPKVVNGLQGLLLKVKVV